MKEIAVFGGSFNPPTKSHEAITRACLDIPDTDEVWLMLSGDRKDKKQGLEDTDREWMVDLMHEEVFKSDPRLKISKFELDYLPRPTQTHKTVEALKKHFPDNNFKFVFGVDSYRSMPKWHKGEDLQRNLGMFIVPRDGIELPAADNVTILDVETCQGLSSTSVREAVANDLPIDKMVCQSVAKYIQDCQLYRD